MLNDMTFKLIVHMYLHDRLVTEVIQLCGRPFGGIICLVKNTLRSFTNMIYCSDSYAIIKVGNCILVNMYLPCVGSVNRALICDNIIAEIDAWCQYHDNCNLVIAGDFNTDLDTSDIVSQSVLCFC